MVEKSSYRRCLAEIEKIESGKDSHPRIPPHASLQEAYDLYVWCQDDIKKLEAVGLNRSVIDELPVRIEAAQKAHSVWQEHKESKGPAREHFEVKLDEALKLKPVLTEAFRYAFRNNKKLKASLSRISKTTSYPALIQCLNNLAVLGKDNLPLLNQIRFDTRLLDEAATLSGELSKALSVQKTEKEDVAEMKRFRDKALIYLKESVDCIREAGCYAFSDNKERRRGYISAYWKKKNRTKKKKNGKDSKGSDKLSQ